MIPYDFIRLEGNCPVYRRIDIDLYGTPDYYGVHEYLVVSTEEVSERSERRMLRLG